MVENILRCFFIAAIKDRFSLSHLKDRSLSSSSQIRTP